MNPFDFLTTHVTNHVANHLANLVVPGRRRHAADLRYLAAIAEPGQEWTSTFIDHDVHGRLWGSFIAGPVRILGVECPVPAYRGHKCLGEMTLSPARYLTLSPKHTLSRADTAPRVEGLNWRFPLTRSGCTVAVERVIPHPVYEGLRWVDVGTLHDWDADPSLPAGRRVGNTLVENRHVTAFDVLDITAEEFLTDVVPAAGDSDD